MVSIELVNMNRWPC